MPAAGVVLIVTVVLGAIAGVLALMGKNKVQEATPPLPERVGLKRWPDIPRDVEWKAGICEVLRLPHAEQADIARAWQAILATVRSWSDLERPLLTCVEQLIDFVTADQPAG